MIDYSFYSPGCGQAGPKSTACINCHPLCGLGGYKNNLIELFHIKRE